MTWRPAAGIGLVIRAASPILLADVDKLRAVDASASDSPELPAGGPASYWLDLRGDEPAAAAGEQI